MAAIKNFMFAADLILIDRFWNDLMALQVVPGTSRYEDKRYVYGNACTGQSCSIC